MTNPLDTGEAGEGTRHGIYRDHVIAAIADPEVAICKLADLVDNALSLHHTVTGERTRRLAGKYAPLLPILLERISAPDVRALMSDAGYDRAAEALRAGTARVERLLDGGSR